MSEPWMSEGRCRELPRGTFFPSDGVGVDVARKICAGCPVKSPCLEYALYYRIEHGVWGGASERERRRIIGRRRTKSGFSAYPAVATEDLSVPGKAGGPPVAAV
jgi:WhiB family redox-sensing transcriptional regulator